MNDFYYMNSFAEFQSNPEIFKPGAFIRRNLESAGRKFRNAVRATIEAGREARRLSGMDDFIENSLRKTKPSSSPLSPSNSSKYLLSPNNSPKYFLSPGNTPKYLPSGSVLPEKRSVLQNIKDRIKNKKALLVGGGGLLTGSALALYLASKAKDEREDENDDD